MFRACAYGLTIDSSMHLPELARSEATSAAKTIASAQVLEHGLRHLAWLAKEDPVVIAVLNDDWKRVLADYRPEPFRNMV